MKAIAERAIADFDALYLRIVRYIKWLSVRRSTDNVLMHADELEGELLFECWKGWQYYQAKRLDDGQLLAVIRTMLENRVNELYTKYHKTHRKLGAQAIDITELEISIGADAVTLIESYDRFASWLNTLTPDEFTIVTAILGPDIRVYNQILLQSWRKSWVYKRAKIDITYALIADALHLPRGAVRALWQSITVKWREWYE